MDADSQREEKTERSEETLGTPALPINQGTINRGDQLSLRRGFSSTGIALSAAHTQAIVQRVVNRVEKPVIWQPSIGKLSPDTVYRFSTDVLGRYPDLSRKYAVETPQTEEGSMDDLPLAQPVSNTASSQRKVRRSARSEPEIPLELLQVSRPPAEPEPAPPQPRQVIHAPGTVQRKPGVRPVSRIEEVTPGSKPKETPAIREKREHLVGRIDEMSPEPADPSLLWRKQEDSQGNQVQAQPIQRKFDPSQPKINEIPEEAIPSDRPKNMKIDSAQIPTFEPRRPRPLQRKPAQALDQTVKESKENNGSFEDPGLSRNLEQVQKKTTESTPAESPSDTGETGIPQFSSSERVRDILEEDKSPSGDENAEQTPVSGDAHPVSPVRSSLSSSEPREPEGTAQPPVPDRQPEIREKIHLPEDESSQASHEEIQIQREPVFEDSIPADTDEGLANLDASLQEFQEVIEPLSSSIQHKYEVETPLDEPEETRGEQPFESHAGGSHLTLGQVDKFPQPSLSGKKPVVPVQRSTGSGSQAPAAAGLSAQDAQKSASQPERSSRSEELRSAEIPTGTNFPEPGENLRHFDEPEGQHIQLAPEVGATERAAPGEDLPIAEDTGGKPVLKVLDDGIPSHGKRAIRKSENETIPAGRHLEPFGKYQPPFPVTPQAKRVEQLEPGATVQQFSEPDGVSEPPQTGSSAITEIRRQLDSGKSEQPVPKLRDEETFQTAEQEFLHGTPGDAVQRMPEDVDLSREPEAREMDDGFSERGDVESASKTVQRSAPKGEPGPRHQPQGSDRENVHGPAEKARIDRTLQSRDVDQEAVQRSSVITARGVRTQKHEPAAFHQPAQDEGIVRETSSEPPRDTDERRTDTTIQEPDRERMDRIIQEPALSGSETTIQKSDQKSTDTTIQEPGQGSIGEISQEMPGGAEQPQAAGPLFDEHPTTIESPGIAHPTEKKPDHDGIVERTAANQVLQRSTSDRAGARESTPEETVRAPEPRESISHIAAPASQQAQQAPEEAAPESGSTESLHQIQRVNEGRFSQENTLNGYAKGNATSDTQPSEAGAETEGLTGPPGSIPPFKFLQRKSGLADELIKRSENRTRLPLFSHINTRHLFDETGARSQEQPAIQRKPGRRADDLPLRSMKPEISASALPESIPDASPHETSKSFASTQPINPLNYPIETRHQTGIIQRLPLAPLPVARAQPEGFVQRAFTPADTVETTPSGSEEADIDLDDLARKVYPLVKRLLVIERERYTGR